MRDLSKLRNVGCCAGRCRGAFREWPKGEDPDHTCPVSECGKEFSFEASETRLFELPISLFERRHFYRSELPQSCPMICRLPEA